MMGTLFIPANIYFMEILKDKNVLLIGATGGIGSKTAKLIAGSGANLFITGRNEVRLKEVAQACNLPVEKCLCWIYQSRNKLPL